MELKLNEISTKVNKERIAIVVIGYNRIEGMKRLLGSLVNADYQNDNVPLIISIDCSKNEELYSYVKDFKWPYGDKYVNIQEERLGLKKHIYQCGDLTKNFKAIALFEDDLWVSPFFYNYIKNAVDAFGNDERICEISLYRNEIFGDNGFYFDILRDGTDCFLWQDISTWGQCWTSQMWDGFRNWLMQHDDEYICNLDIPTEVKSWTRAWSKYYIAYEIDTKKFVVFPHESLTTNFNDVGGEHGGGGNFVQVNVLHGARDYKFAKVEEMVKYDIFGNNIKLLDCLEEKYYGQVSLDLYGLRDSYQNCRYVLTTKLLPYMTIEEWGLEMRPIELNIFYKVKGKGIRLYDLTKPVKFSKRFNTHTNQTFCYHLRNFKLRYLIEFIFIRLKNKIMRIFYI